MNHEFDPHQAEMAALADLEASEDYRRARIACAVRNLTQAAARLADVAEGRYDPTDNLFGEPIPAEREIGQAQEQARMALSVLAALARRA